jgi:hypothetical protein
MVELLCIFVSIAGGKKVVGLAKKVQHFELLKLLTYFPFAAH